MKTIFKNKKLLAFISFLIVFVFSSFLSIRSAYKTVDIDENEALIQRVYDDGDTKTIFLRCHKDLYLDPTNFSEKQVQALKDRDALFIDKSPIDFFYSSYPDDTYSGLRYFLSANHGKSIVVNGKSDLSDFGVKRFKKLSDGISCELPKNDKEIAITDFYAEYFLANGCLNEQTMARIEFSSYDEIIGSEIDGITITGIYSTEESIDKWENWGNSERSKDGTGTEKQKLARGHYLAQYVFSYNSDSEKEYSNALIKLSGSIKKDVSFVKSIDEGSNHPFLKLVNSDLLKTNIKYVSVETKYSVILGVFKYNDNYQVDIFVVLIPFLVLSLMPFISLKNLLSKNNFVENKAGFKIAVLEITFVSLLAFAASMIATVVACSIFNAIISIDVYSINVVSALMTALYCLLLALPNLLIYKLSSKKDKQS